MPDVNASINNIREKGFYQENNKESKEPSLEQSKEKEKKVRPELFDQVARDLGQAFAKTSRVSSSQLRGFFGEVKALEVKLQEMSRHLPESHSSEGGIAETVYQRNEYLVRMVAPKIAYIQGKRTGNNVSKEFRDFIETSIDKVRSAQDFTVFMRLFESVVGFFYGFEGGRNK